MYHESVLLLHTTRKKSHAFSKSMRGYSCRCCTKFDRCACRVIDSVGFSVHSTCIAFAASPTQHAQYVHMLIRGRKPLQTFDGLRDAVRPRLRHCSPKLHCESCNRSPPSPTHSIQLFTTVPVFTHMYNFIGCCADAPVKLARRRTAGLPGCSCDVNCCRRYEHLGHSERSAAAYSGKHWQPHVSSRM